MAKLEKLRERWLRWRGISVVVRAGGRASSEPESAGDAVAAGDESMPGTAPVDSRSAFVAQAAHAAAARADPGSAEASLGVLFEEAPIAIAVLVGPHHVVERANARACRLWRLSPSEIVGRPLLVARPELAALGIEKRLARVRATGVAEAESQLFASPLDGDGVAQSFVGPPPPTRLEIVYQPLRGPTGSDGRILLLGTEVSDAVEARRGGDPARDRAEARCDRLFDLLAGAPMPMCVVDGKEHRCRFVNAAWRALVGTADGADPTPAAIDGRSAGADFTSAVDEVLRTGEPLVRRELPLHGVGSGDGPHRIVNLAFAPTRDEAGRIDGVLVSAADVTELVTARRCTEALADKLRESDERLRRVVEASGAGLWELDPATGTIEGDASFKALLGFGPDEPLTLAAALARVHTDDRGRLARAVRAALDGADGGRCLVEFGTTGSDGAPPRCLEGRAHTLSDGDGRPARLAGALLDVTARKQAEAVREQWLGALQRSEEGFRTLANSLPVAVWTADAEDRVLWTNDVLPSATGVPAEVMCETGYWAFVHPDDAATTRPAWDRARAARTPFEVQHRIRHADGCFRWHLVRITPASETEGALRRWIGTSTDIHEQRLLQSELERRHDFEKHLAGMVSHDLRNPLQAILISVELLLQDKALGDRTRALAERIHSSARRAARLIRDLLDFTEVRLGGGLRLHRRPSDLAALVRATVEELRAAYPGREVTCRTAGAARGRFDTDRLAQVVTNLAANALKYGCRDRAVEVTVALAPDAPEGRDADVVLSVHNDGEPIPADCLERIFEPLQRGDDRAAAGVERSLGLGLYIVNAIVAAHGGRVCVESTAVAGTTFTVRLPRDPCARSA